MLAYNDGARGAAYGDVYVERASSSCKPPYIPTHKGGLRIQSKCQMPANTVVRVCMHVAVMIEGYTPQDCHVVTVAINHTLN